MSDSEQKPSALEQMDIKQLLINLRLNLDKTRGEARSALRQIKDKSHEVNNLVLAVDKIRGKYESRISTLEEQVETLIAAIVEINSTPWYKKIWNKTKWWITLKIYRLKK